MSALLLIFLTLTALAQSNYQFSLEGSFPASPESYDPSMVNFKLQWNEEERAIRGVYQDNFYTQSMNIEVTGSSDERQRNFNVVLPDITQGAKSLALTLAVPGVQSGSVPVRVRALDSVGGEVNEASLTALMTLNRPILTSETSPCEIGFGALSGFCGLYSGSFIESSDTNNRCELVSSSGIRFELAPSTEMKIYLYYQDSLLNLPFHQLGGFITSPVSPTINHSHRHCGILDGTTFLPTSCKELNLSGTFFNTGGEITFIGNYTITDEENNDSCTYRMSFKRDVIY